MEKGYEDLYIAIWTTAIQTDYRNAVNRLTDYALKNAYEEYKLNAITLLPAEDIMAIRRAINSMAAKACKRLMPRIKELVYAEAQVWPNGKRGKDAEFERMFAELKKQALAFARGEFTVAEEKSKKNRRKIEEIPKTCGENLC